MKIISASIDVTKIDKTKLVLESMDTILTVEAEEVEPDKTSWLDTIVTSTSASTNSTALSWMDAFLNSSQSSDEDEEDGEE